MHLMLVLIIIINILEVTVRLLNTKVTELTYLKLDMSDDQSSRFSSLTSAKSIFVFCIGFFCILFINHLIRFGKKWKQLISRLGYTTIHMLSPTETSSRNGSLPSCPSSSSSVHHSAAVTCSSLPTLRIPDASWFGFLLAWIELNFAEESALLSTAWLSGVNERLDRQFTESPSTANGSAGCKSNNTMTHYIQHIKILEILPESSSPRLSLVESSASGSTKQLYFHYSTSTPDIWLKLQVDFSPSTRSSINQAAVATDPVSSNTDEVPRRRNFLLHLNQVDCRVQLMCTPLPDKSLVLSWNLISVILMKSFELFTYDSEQQRVPVSDRSRSPPTTNGITAPLRQATSSLPNSRPAPSIRQATHLLVSFHSARLEQPRDGKLRCDQLLESPLDLVAGKIRFRCLLRLPGGASSRFRPPLLPDNQSFQSLMDYDNVDSSYQSDILATSVSARLTGAFGEANAVNKMKESNEADSRLNVVWDSKHCVPVPNSNLDLLDVWIYSSSLRDKHNERAHLCGHAIIPLGEPKKPGTQLHFIPVECRLQPGATCSGEQQQMPLSSSVSSAGHSPRPSLPHSMSELFDSDDSQQSSLIVRFNLSLKTLFLMQQSSSTSEKCRPVSRQEAPPPVITQATSNLVSSTPPFPIRSTTLVGDASADLVAQPAHNRGSGSIVSMEQIVDFMTQPTTDMGLNGEGSSSTSDEVTDKRNKKSKRERHSSSAVNSSTSSQNRSANNSNASSSFKTSSPTTTSGTVQRRPKVPIWSRLSLRRKSKRNQAQQQQPPTQQHDESCGNLNSAQSRGSGRLIDGQPSVQYRTIDSSEHIDNKSTNSELTINPPEGIVAGPLNEENFFEWEALIAGPENTPFEGGVFSTRLTFPTDYPLSPPKMRFTTEIFHPNNGMNSLTTASIDPIQPSSTNDLKVKPDANPMVEDVKDQPTRSKTDPNIATEPESAAAANQDESPVDDYMLHNSNEDTAKTEDLKNFLAELHEKVYQEQQQLKQQQEQLQSQQQQQYQPSSTVGGGDEPPGEVFNDATDSQPQAEQQPSYDQQQLTECIPTDPPLDGGWGWVVVLGSFCLLALVDGICYSYGLLLSSYCPQSTLYVQNPSLALSSNSSSGQPTFEPYPFTTSRLKPSYGSCIPQSEMGDSLGTQRRALLLTPIGVATGLCLLLGPIISALSNQFDFRPVAGAGIVLTSVALGLTSQFATNIPALVGLFGVLGGIGLALIYLPAIAIVGHWFQRRRPMAVGVALCGSGVGCLLAAQGVPHFTSWLTWRGAVAFLAACAFQCSTLVAFFRPLDVHAVIDKNQKAKQAVKDEERRLQAMRRYELERRIREARLRHYLQVQANKGTRAMPNLPRGPPPPGGPTSRGLPPTSRHRRHNLRPQALTMTSATGTTNYRFAVGQQQVHPSFMTAISPYDAHRDRLGGGRRKRTPSRRLIVYRGSIMQRIIEEKRRQRTVSVGSLDGMVITRDNELIAASPSITDRPPLISSSVINRIAESVTRKMQAAATSTSSPPPPARSSTTSQPASGLVSSRSSQTQLYATLPQAVAEYINSQLLVQQQTPSGLTSPGMDSLSAYQHLVTVGGGGVNSNNNQQPSTATPKLSCCSTQMSSAAGGVVPPASSLTTVSPSNASSTVDLLQDPSASAGHDTVSERFFAFKHHRTVASRVRAGYHSESTSLRRVSSSSTTSLDSRQQTGVSVNLPMAAALPAGIVGDVDDDLSSQDRHQLILQLDDEVKAEIRSQLKRELSRPQFRKDLFFTGSIKQLAALNQVEMGDDLEQLVAKPEDVFSPDSNFTVRPSNLSINQYTGQHPSVVRPARHTVSSFTPVGVGPSTVGGGGNRQSIDTQTDHQTLPFHRSSAPAVVHSSYLPTIPAATGAPINAVIDQQPSNSATTTLLPTSDDQDQPCLACDLGMENDDYDDIGNADDLGGDLGDNDLEDDVQVIYGSNVMLGGHRPVSRCCGRVVSKLPLSLTDWSPLRFILADLLSPHILTNPVFLLMLASSAITSLGLSIPYLMLPDLLIETGSELKNAAFIVSAMGLGSTAGRILATFYIEKTWSNSSWWTDTVLINAISLLVLGLAVVIAPLVRARYMLLLLASTLFGVASSVHLSLKSIILVDLIGIDRLTNAFGYLLVTQGVGAIIGPPLAGLVWDWRVAQLPPFNPLTMDKAPFNDSTSLVFYLTAGYFFTACLLSLPLRSLAKLIARRQQQKSSYDGVGDGAGGQIYDVNDLESLAAAANQQLVNNVAVDIDRFDPAGLQPVATAVEQQQQSTIPLVVDQLSSTQQTFQDSLDARMQVMDGGTATTIVDGMQAVVSADATDRDAAGNAVVAGETVLVVDPSSVAAAALLAATSVAPSTPITTSPGNNGSMATSTNMPLVVEMLSVKEDPGLEPVAEEEEEDYDDFDDDYPLPDDNQIADLPPNPVDSTHEEGVLLSSTTTLSSSASGKRRNRSTALGKPRTSRRNRSRPSSDSTTDQLVSTSSSASSSSCSSTNQLTSVPVNQLTNVSTTQTPLESSTPTEESGQQQREEEHTPTTTSLQSSSPTPETTDSQPQ